MPEKTCSKCNAAFKCGCEQAGCWCESLFVEKNTLEQLKTEYDNCLCPKCLEQYSVKTEKNNP